ncbi:MAG: hypothetical protein QXK37_03320 [Candidatus Woesearchaeota archaeon]
MKKERKCEICSKENLNLSNSIVLEIQRTGHVFVFCKSCILRRTRQVNAHIKKHLTEEYPLHTYFTR